MKKSYLFLFLAMLLVIFFGEMKKDEPVEVQKNGVIVNPENPPRVGEAYLYPPPYVIGELDVYNATHIQKTICNKNWTTDTIRPSNSYTKKLKLAQLQKPEFTDKNPANYVEDHLCSLQNGGSPTSTTNLWPQEKVLAKEKDKLESHIHSLICEGKITPQNACNRMAWDWYGWYEELGLDTIILGGSIEGDE